MEQNRTLTTNELFPGGMPPKDGYLTALTAEAVRCGIFTAEEEMDVRRRVMEVLAERIRDFTDGESTSVREETAGQLLSSVLYTVGIALLDTGSHRAALAMLREKPMTKIHDDGMGITMRTKTRAKLLSLLLLKTQLPGRSEGYNRFVGRDAYRYVHRYNALYNAREELPVRIDELGIRETCRGIMRVAEVMTDVIRYNQKNAKNAGTEH